MERKTPGAGFPVRLDDCQRAQEPELLALPLGGPANPVAHVPQRISAVRERSSSDRRLRILLDYAAITRVRVVPPDLRALGDGAGAGFSALDDAVPAEMLRL
jgi:hypothetical protein